MQAALVLTAQFKCWHFLLPFCGQGVLQIQELQPWVCYYLSRYNLRRCEEITRWIEQTDNGNP